MIKKAQSANRKITTLNKISSIILILFLQLSFISFANADSTSMDLRTNFMSQKIILDSWGNVFYHDSYDIYNIGETRITKINLQLPKEAEDITVYDLIGALTFTSFDEEGFKMVTITLRYPLREKNDVHNDSFSFTINYRMDIQRRVTRMTSWSRYRFTTILSTNLNGTIKNWEVNIILPEGAKCLQTMPSNVDISNNLFTPSITHVFHNVTSAIDYTFMVEYEYDILWSAFRPTLWVGTIVALIGSVTIIRRRKKPLLRMVSNGNLNLIRSFVETCDRRLMLWSDIESLEESFDNKRIGRKDYSRRKRILEQRIRVLNKAFVNLANRLKQSSVHYESFVERIDSSEEQIQVLKTDLRRLRTQYRTRKISKKAYTKLRRNCIRRIERITADIEGLIIELKGKVD